MPGCLIIYLFIYPTMFPVSTLTSRISGAVPPRPTGSAYLAYSYPANSSPGFILGYLTILVCSEINILETGSAETGTDLFSIK